MWWLSVSPGPGPNKHAYVHCWPNSALQPSVLTNFGRPSTGCPAAGCEHDLCGLMGAAKSWAQAIVGAGRSPPPPGCQLVSISRSNFRCTSSPACEGSQEDAGKAVPCPQPCCATACCMMVAQVGLVYVYEMMENTDGPAGWWPDPTLRVPKVTDQHPPRACVCVCMGAKARVHGFGLWSCVTFLCTYPHVSCG